MLLTPEQTKINNQRQRKAPRPVKPTKKQIAKIPLSEEEHQKLSGPPRTALARFAEGKQDANDWYIVSFRIRIARYVVEMKYQEQQEVLTSLELAHCVTLEMLAAFNLNNGYNWSVSPAQLQTLTTAMDLMDEIQRDADRETLIFTTRKVHREMIRFTS